MVGSQLVAIGSWVVIVAATSGIVLLVGMVIDVAVKAIWVVRRSGGVARLMWPWLRQIAWMHLAGAAAGFSVASAAAQDFVSSHHDLMAATFSTGGVVPSLTQVFHGRALGAVVLVAAAGAAALAARLLRHVIGSTWRLLRSPVVRWAPPAVWRKGFVGQQTRKATDDEIRATRCGDTAPGGGENRVRQVRQRQPTSSGLRRLDRRGR